LRTAFGGERDSYIIARPYQLVVKPEPISYEDRTTYQSVASNDPSASQEQNLLEERLPTELLKLYYPDSDLRAQNLFRYSYSVDGHEITTNIVTSDSWLGLATPISERAFRSFPLLQPSVPLPPISELERHQLEELLRKRGIRFHDNPIYCLQSFTPHDPRTIASFSMAHYIDYKLKLGWLEEELALALVNSDFAPKTAYSKRQSLMPLRNELLPDSKTMADYGRRLCAGGTNILLLFRKPDQEGFCFLVKRRSGKVSTGRRLFSLLPSGMHQPTTRANAREETSIAATVYRETYEELFGGKEVERDDKHVEPRWYMSQPQLAWFEENTGSFTLELVSFGINLVDGTYEFGVLLVVQDEQYWKKFGRTTTLNYEFHDSETLLYSTVDAERLASLMTDPRCADVSLIVLVEGLRRLAQLDPGRINLPRIEIIT
jgi:hypothetical protein